MKNSILVFSLFAACTAMCAERPAWQNPLINSENREPARAYSMPLASVEDAFTGELEPETKYRKSLNGVWKFSWCGALSQRPMDFYRVDFDDSEWGTIDVPSCVEMRGWGVPNYVNGRYPFEPKPPIVPDDPNYVSSYRTKFEIPSERREFTIRPGFPEK